MTMDMKAVKDHAVANFKRLHKAWLAMSRASGELRESHEWADTATEFAPLVSSVESIAAYAQHRLYEEALKEAARIGFLLAQDIAAEVRESSEPVVTLTGNSMMPPIRNYSLAEVAWDVHDSTMWEAFHDRFEDTLQEQGIDYGSPDYDNALYAVDTRRWEFNVIDDVEVQDDPNSWLDNNNYTQKENA